MTHPPPYGGAQTSLQAMSPAGHSCDSAMPLSVRSPVPHPNPLDSWSTPQQMRGSGLFPGKPRHHWKIPTPPHLGKGKPGENLCHAYAYVSIPVLRTPYHALNQSQADAIQLCLQGRGGCPYVQGGTTHSDSSSLRNPLFPAYILTGGPVLLQVPLFVLILVWQSPSPYCS